MHKYINIKGVFSTMKLQLDTDQSDADIIKVVLEGYRRCPLSR